MAATAQAAERRSGEGALLPSPVRRWFIAAAAPSLAPYDLAGRAAAAANSSIFASDVSVSQREPPQLNCSSDESVIRSSTQAKARSHMPLWPAWRCERCVRNVRDVPGTICPGCPGNEHPRSGGTFGQAFAHLS